MSKKKKVLHIVQVIFFLMILGAGTAAVLFGACEGKTHSELEKRELKAFPEVKAKDIFSGKFESDFSDALSDHTWGRDLFVTAKTWAQIVLGTREIDGVYIDGERLIETYKDSDFDDKQIRENIADVTGFLSATANGIGPDHVKMMLVPSKCSLYRGEMPAYMATSARADTIAKELRDTLAENLVKGEPAADADEAGEESDEAGDDTGDDEAGSDEITDDEDDLDFDFDEGDPDAEESDESDDGDDDEFEDDEEDEPEEETITERKTLEVNKYDEASAKAAAERMIIDLRPALRSHKTEPIYYLTDHHWTTLGAGYAYEELQKQAAGTITGMQTETVADDFLGTDYNRIHYYQNKDEIKKVSIPEADAATAEINDSGDIIKKDSIYDPQALQTADKYNYFFSGNYSAITVNTGAKNNKTLLIVKDSFSNSLVPYLCRDYQKIIMVDLRYVNSSIYDYLPQNERPDDVLVVYNEEKFMQDTHQMYLK